MEKRKNIYLDHAATTPLSKEVAEIMQSYYTNVFGNANSQHSYGRDATIAVINAREQVAKSIGAKASEIYFTGGGTEADNWAIKGAALEMKSRGRGNHIITSKIEHPAVYNSCQQLEKYGFEVTYLDVDKDGFVSKENLEKAIRKDTILVSIMFANNEIGTIEPIRELAEVAHAHNILFHTDAVQAAGSIAIDVKDLGVDMLSLSGHKFYGPKGIGALYIRGGVKIEKLLTGGEQERAQRGGTTNVPAAVGLGEAIAAATANMEENAKVVSALRDRFVKGVKEKIEYIRYNGTEDNSKRLPNNASFSFQYIEGESILYSLDLAGISASSGSACSSGSLDPSRTLLSIGVPVGVAHGTIRFTFGTDNTNDDVDYTLEKLVEIVARLRNMSPLFKISKEDTKNV
ncbi:MAG TPA: cysteine desulfurase NifS [Clostridia bacterium]|nr:cysteine desulfurase NifS [Clostridia bacterium]